MKVTKAVIPAAGLGTRVLPASKAIPKEMLPIIDKPAIQYIVEEAALSGITDILIITSYGKDAIIDHFDRNPFLESQLLLSGKEELYESVVLPCSLANISYIRQQERKGLGHAVLCAKSFVGKDPFVVMYGDDVILGEVPATGELCAVFEKTNCPVLGVKQVELSTVSRYGCIAYEDTNEGMVVTDMVEKPLPEDAPSPYAILGRVLLTPDIFSILETTLPGVGDEIQLTDAMRVLLKQRKMRAVEYSGTRFDMGNRFGMIEATLTEALNRADLRNDVLQLMRELVSTETSK
jgi:UTP--glucose-1-phosphate uridylyltransferase